MPDNLFPSGIWRSILPYSGGLIDIRDYPPSMRRTPSSSPKASQPKDVGNAYVTVLTNRFIEPDSVGTLAVWLALSRQEILTTIHSDKWVPHFWAFDPQINKLPYKSCIWQETATGIAFLNPGKHFERDAEGRVIYDQGKPREVQYPPPYSGGFVEARIRYSSKRLEYLPFISKTAEMDYELPAKEDKGAQVQIVRVRSFVVENTYADRASVEDSIFEPKWTNLIAAVVDNRAGMSVGRPLTYTTKAQELNLTQDGLEKQLKKVEKMMANRRNLSPRVKSLTAVCILLALCLLPIAFWRIAKISQKERKETI